MRATGETVVQALASYEDLTPGRNSQGKTGKIPVDRTAGLRPKAPKKPPFFLVPTPLGPGI